MEHRTAELLLELHASHYQASHPQASQPRRFPAMDIVGGNHQGGYPGDREMPSIEYTIEGEHPPTQSLRNVEPPHASRIKNEPQSFTAHQTARSAIKHTENNTAEERTKILSWAQETLHRGQPPHPVILKLMEQFMKRAVSEPATLPSAIKRITRLPTYARKETSSGENAVGEKAGEASSVEASLKGDRGSTTIAKARSSLGGRTVIQEGGRKNKRAKRLSARLAGKGASGDDSLRGISSSCLNTKNVDTASSLNIPPSSHTLKTSSTIASFSSQPAVKRQHYCIRDGHQFKLLPLKKAGVAGGGGRTENKIGARKYKCGKCEGRIDETRILMCGVEVCGVMVCRECKRDWEILGDRRLRGS